MIYTAVAKVNMTLIEILLLLVIAAIVGVIAQSLVGYWGGGVLVTIALGFIGAVFGTWLAGRLGLPDIFSIHIGSVTFPIIWAIIGAVLFIALVSLTTRGRRWSVTPPTRVVLVLSIVLAVLSLLESYGKLSLPISAYVLMALAYIILLLGNLIRGL